MDGSATLVIPVEGPAPKRSSTMLAPFKDWMAGAFPGGRNSVTGSFAEAEAGTNTVSTVTRTEATVLFNATILLSCSTNQVGKSVPQEFGPFCYFVRKGPVRER